MDVEEGHLLPSFGLAQALKRRGHDICYLTVVDNGDLVKEQGLEFRPILQDIYHKGYKDKYRKLSPPPGGRSLTKDLQEEYIEHIAQLMKGHYDVFIEDLGASLVIISSFLKLDTLILYYKYGITPVIFTPFLRHQDSTPARDTYDFLNDTPADEIYSLVEFVIGQGYNIDSLEQLVSPLDAFYELIACPADLEVGRTDLRDKLFYIEPSIRKGATVGDIYATYNITPGKKIIYASMGSQPIRHGEVCDAFFGKVIEAMRCEELMDTHLILAVGPGFDTGKLGAIPGNITLAKWAPQLDILKVASLAIIHGGLGSVKECIYYGVPMIVFPLGYDQPQNAERISYHHLGVAGNIETISATDLRAHIGQVMNDTVIRSSMARMQRIFQDKEDTSPGADIIEDLLQRLSI